VTPVVSNDNPHRHLLTNSDLERAAVLLQDRVLHQEVDMGFAFADLLSDNMPTMAWRKEFVEIWEQRNNLIHGTYESSQDLAKRSKVIA
jgi:hypothetical protein